MTTDRFKALNQRVRPNLPSLVRELLPYGRQEGREWVALNPTRHDRRLGSFRINLGTGVWADFATGDAGGDVISLFAYIHGLTQKSALLLLERRMGVAHER